MTEEQVVALMMSSKNEQQWNDNADKVQEACGGYPQFWWNAIMMSGLAHEVKKNFIRSGNEWANDVSKELFM